MEFPRAGGQYPTSVKIIILKKIVREKTLKTLQNGLKLENAKILARNLWYHTVGV